MSALNRVNPATRQIWNIGESKAGNVASFDPSALEISRVSAEDGIDFGAFISLDANNKVTQIVAADTAAHGIALISNLADGYDEDPQVYNTEDQVAIGRRGYFWVAIDPANAPVAGGAVLITDSLDPIGAGRLTTLVTNSDVADPTAVSIEQVLENVAEVYLTGLPVISLT